MQTGLSDSAVGGGSNGVGKPRCAAAFSLVELLVVMAVIAILITLAFKGGSAVLEHGRERDTETLFGMLNQAIDTFYAEKPYVRNRDAMQRYGGYPPDELAVLDGDAALPTPGARLVNPTASIENVYLGPAVPAIDTVDPQLLGTDVRALALAIRLRSPKAATILDGIPERFQADVPPDELYQAGDGDPGIRLVYYVDAWGTPIEYYATRTPSDRKSNQHAAFSAWAMQKSGGRPVFVSYGPNGDDQKGTNSSVAVDAVGGSGDPDLVINHPFNDDNVYSPEAFADRVRR